MTKLNVRATTPADPEPIEQPALDNHMFELGSSSARTLFVDTSSAEDEQARGFEPALHVSGRG